MMIEHADALSIPRERVAFRWALRKIMRREAAGRTQLSDEHRARLMFANRKRGKVILC